ncbi:unnamed protein product, partial [Polarella glacialis]
YEPDGGPAELLCSEPKEPWKTAPARCTPSTGSAALWRSKLRYSALFSLLGIATTAVVVAAGCWREPSRGVHTPVHQGQRIPLPDVME